MKILVVSDTHRAVFQSVLGRLKEEKDVDILIHCGDNYHDAEGIIHVVGADELYRVVGNCDHDVRGGEDLLELNIENKRFLVTHGHLQHVKDGMDILKKLAEEKKADVVLFGHTHTSYMKTENGILYFNPGSTILPKGCKAGYGVIEITDDKIVSKFVEL